jgi:cytochrome c
MKRMTVALLLLLAVACNRDEAAKPMAKPAEAEAAPIGNAERGKALTAQYGCNVCHAVPGIEGPQGSLGPSLAGVASRPTISFGAVQNTPGNLVKYIQDPQSMNPQSGMPPVGLTDVDAQDIGAYMFTLK